MERAEADENNERRRRKYCLSCDVFDFFRSLGGNMLCRRFDDIDEMNFRNENSISKCISYLLRKIILIVLDQMNYK